jgi:glyoxylase-like metal-dependent hydrolase (beta-lactamase superfamily II)
MMLRNIMLGVLLSMPLAQAFAAASVSDYAMKAEPVAEGVYAVITPAKDFPSAENKGWNSNATFVVTDEGVLVFDTGSSETIGQALRNTIAGVTDTPVRWVINSHAHGDHWLGNGAFAEDGVEIISSQVVQTRIRTEGPEWVARFKQMTNGATGDSTVVAPNRGLREPLVREFGGVRVEVLFSGNSHSPGDVVFWLPKERVLLTGDVMYTGRPPATFDADVQQWTRFLDELEALDPAVVVPGHGPVGRKTDVALLRNYFETLWTAVSEGYEEGLPDFEIAPRVKARMVSFEKDFPGIDERLGESVSHVYLQVEESAF